MYVSPAQFLVVAIWAVLCSDSHVVYLSLTLAFSVIEYMCKKTGWSKMQVAGYRLRYKLQVNRGS